MTGRRPSRGAGGQPWRGGRPDGRADGRDVRSVPPRAAGPGEQARRAELEELAIQRVRRRTGARVGLGSAIAVLALAGLLAGGLGLLGGRPQGLPAPSGAAAGPSTSPASPALPGRSPLVTPWMACGPDPLEPPKISLQSNGVPTPGLVEPVVDAPATEAAPTRATTPGNPFAGIRGPRVTVRPDVVTELWIDGGACALDWSIELIDVVTGTGYVLDQGSNPWGDPDYAAQNRFNVSAAMGQHRTRGHDVQFGGVFVFRTITVRAFWRLRIETLDAPLPALWTFAPRNDRIPVVGGCDVVLALGSGWEEQVNACGDDLSADPGPAAFVRPGETLELRFDSWEPSTLVVICGRLSDLAFIAEPEPGCFLEAPDGRFVVPAELGRWTLALASCASEAGSLGANRICGTWYANVEITTEPRPEPTFVRFQGAALSVRRPRSPRPRRGSPHGAGRATSGSAGRSARRRRRP